MPEKRGGKSERSKASYKWRGVGGDHFSVQTRKESALIIEFVNFVSGSHVAELIQHQNESY